MPNQPPRTDGDRYADLRIKDHPSDPATYARATARLADDVAPLLAEREELHEYVAQLTHDLAASERAREAYLAQRDAALDAIERVKAWRHELLRRASLVSAACEERIFEFLDVPDAPKELTPGERLCARAEQLRQRLSALDATVAPQGTP